jgi:hypothetical protein
MWGNLGVVKRKFTKLIIVERIRPARPTFRQPTSGERDQRRKPVFDGRKFGRSLENIIFRWGEPIIFIVATRQVHRFEVWAEEVFAGILQLAFKAQKVCIG